MFFQDFLTMDTTEILLVICVALISITLMLLVGACCVFRRYMKSNALRSRRYTPSYHLETTYTNGAHANEALREGKTKEEHLVIQNYSSKDEIKTDGNKNETAVKT